MSRCFDVNYEEIAHGYALHRNASERVVARLLTLMGEKAPARILEAGCGTADYLYVLSKALKARGYGFDRSSAMLQQAENKNPGLDLREGDASLRFPFENTCFDLVFSVDVIHYIGDLAHFFEEAARVLAPGGTVITVTDSEDDIRNRTLAHYFPETVPNELHRYPGINAICQAMGEAGFSDLSVTHTEYREPMSEARLERYRQKAYSSLRFVSEPAFSEGIRRMEQDTHAGACVSRELYTYISARKG